ncbi:MAG: YccF domain-containing protein [Mediterraneibacter faecis]
MKLLGNILWFLCGGIIGGLAWIIAGCIWCVTIVGIPVGLQCFKFASLAFWPFGKEVVYGNGTFSFLVNLIWIVFFGWGMALGNIVLGCMWCITIVESRLENNSLKWRVCLLCLLVQMCFRTTFLYKKQSG